MPALTVRNIPDATMDGLHRRAKRARRSLNGEILLIFEDAVEGRDSSVSRKQERKSTSALDRKSRLKALAGSWKDSRSADEIIADIVSARTMGREISL
jgi:plasmid stability protein